MTVSAHWCAAARGAHRLNKPTAVARRPLHLSARRSGAEKSSGGQAATEAPRGVPYNQLRVGVPKETFAKERRVGLSPAAAANLTKKVSFFLSRWIHQSLFI